MKTPTQATGVELLSMVSPEPQFAGILKRVGSSTDRWQARLAKLKTGRLLGRLFATSRVRLGEAATTLGVQDLWNLDGCVAY